MSVKQNSTIDIDHIAHLARLPLTEDEKILFRPQLAAILSYINKLNEVPTDNVAPTSQVTGLVNIFRNDEIDLTRMLTQKEALANAPEIHNGYIKVKAIFNE